MSHSEALRIIPLGGLGEIGMNCMILEYQDEILIVDCGVLFSDLEHFGVEFAIPDFSYLQSRKEKIKAIVITHGHEDHIGAIPFAIKAGIHAPVYASAFSALLIRERLKEYGLEQKVNVHVFQMREEIKFKHFKVRTESVNHSIVDSAALFIDTPLGKIIHTGDFKIDPTPFYGQMIDLDVFGRAGQEGVLLLMSDSTNVERHQHSLSESVIYRKFEQLFAAAEGLTVVAMFASNIGRMGQIFELARRLKKRVAIAGRGMERNVQLGLERGFLTDAQSVLISLDDLSCYPRREIIVLATGSQAESGAALSRVALGDHRKLEIQQSDLVLLSSRYIPGNEKAIGRMVNHLFKQGAEVLYEAIHDIHVSGHATRPELKQMLELTRPRFFLPIHGEYRHLVHHQKVALESGIPSDRILVAVNGDVIELSQEQIKITDHFEEPRILIEGRDGQDVSKLILKERRNLGEKGIVFVLMVRNTQNGKIISGPEIITKGFISETMEGWLVEEGKKLIKKVIHKQGPGHDLQETVRIELRRFFKQNTGKKPVVLPIVLDM